MKQAPVNDGHAFKPLAVMYLEDTLEKGGTISIPCLNLEITRSLGETIVARVKSFVSPEKRMQTTLE